MNQLFLTLAPLALAAAALNLFSDLTPLVPSSISLNISELPFLLN